MSDADQHDPTRERLTEVSRPEWPAYGPYQVEACIGRGGQGEVFRAHDTRLGRTVAIKRAALSRDESVRLRFEREIRTAARLVHPRVATVFDVIDTPDGPMLVMEYVDGAPITRHVRERGRSLALVLRLARQMAEALDAIHAVGFVHRDLKPANVFVTTSDDVKVMDFGIAHGSALPSMDESREAAETGTTDVKLTRPGRVSGTPGYTSPEQLRGEPLDARSDLFALGVILFELLTGEHPFRRSSAEEISAAVQEAKAGTKASRALLRRSGGLQRLVDQLLEKSRAHRPASAKAVLRELDAFEGRQRASRAWRPALAVAAVAIAGAGLWSLRTQGIPEQQVRALDQARLERASVAVLPFEFASPGEGEEGYGHMVADLLAGELSESGSLRGIASFRVEELLDGLPAESGLSRQLARVDEGLRADYVVSGRLHREGVNYLATIDLHPRDAASEPASFTLTARRCASLARQAARAIAGAAGRPDALGIEVEPTLALDRLSDEARLLYERAERLVRERNLAEAAELLERAIELEPEFLEAQVLLSNTAQQAGLEQRARQHAQEVELLEEELGLKAKERLALEARAVVAGVRGDAKAVLETRRALFETYPDEPELALGYASALVNVGSLEEGLAVLDDLQTKGSASPRTALARARVLTSLGRHDEAEEALARSERGFTLLDLKAGLAEVHESRAFLRYVQKRTEDARADYLGSASLFDAAGLPVRAILARKSAADMDLIAFRLEDAADGYERALDGLVEYGHYSQMITTLAGLAGCELRLGRVRAAEARVREAIAEADKLGNEGLRVVPQLTLASVLAATGRAESALREARDLERRAAALQHQAFVDYARALRALALAQELRFEEAIETVEPLRTEGYWLEGYGAMVAADILELAGRASEALEAYEFARNTYGEDSPTELALAELGLARARAGIGRPGALEAYETALAVGGNRASQDLDDAIRWTRAHLARVGALPREDLPIDELTEGEPPADAPQARSTLHRRRARLAEARLLIEMDLVDEARRLATQVLEHAWSSDLDRREARRVLDLIES